MVFVIGLGLYIRTKLGYVATAFGIFSCISCSLVGVFPMNNPSIHDAVTFSFFSSGFIAITLFDLVTISDQQKKVSKWLLIPGIVTLASFASYLVIRYITSSAHRHTLDAYRLVRSHVRLTPILEWFVFFSVIAWFVSMSIYLLAKRPTRLQNPLGQ